MTDSPTLLKVLIFLLSTVRDIEVNRRDLSPSGKLTPEMVIFLVFPLSH